jgi:hypothetical protein
MTTGGGLRDKFWRWPTPRARADFRAWQDERLKRRPPELPLPASMVVAFEQGQWPTGRIDAAPLAARAPFIRDIPLEFVDSMEAVAAGRGGAWGPVAPVLLGSTAAEEHLGRGSLEAVPGLPWLDVDLCLPFGGGDLGDELWLVLDYRPSPTEPRVVANEICYTPGKPVVFWRELAPSFGDFWRTLGLASAWDLPVICDE